MCISIIELSNEIEDLQIHCLCILLKLAGPTLLKVKTKLKY